MKKPGKQEDGFILLLTLWVLVIVAIAASYFGERVARAVELAQQSSQNSRALIDMASTRAEILLRLSTTTLTEFGLGRGTTTVYLDNRLYQGEGDTVFQIQDERGLLNLNLIDDDRLYRLLGQLGVESEQRGRMTDTLRDYIDSDSLTRLNGAEENEYRALNLPPPTNRNLVTPWQAKQIIGWRDALALWTDNRLSNLSTTSQAMGINPNTAPTEVLSTLPGVTEGIAKALIAQRQITPLTHEGHITQFTGMPLNLPMGMGVVAVPSDTMRLTQTIAGLPWAVQYTIKLTPSNPLAPWQTDFYSKIDLAGGPIKPIDITTLPPRTITGPDRLPWFLMPR